MRIRRTNQAVIAGLAATVLAVSVPGAVADGGTKTRIEITKLNPTWIKGTIESGRSSCESGRHVQVFRYDGFRSVKVGRKDAQPDGDWNFRKDLKPGRYFAKVDSKPGCRYDVSPEKRLN